MKNKIITKKIIVILIIFIISSLIFYVYGNKLELSLRHPCKQKPLSGNCMAAINIYYFDQETQTCKEFLWGGCGGRVPFKTLESCQIKCEENS